MQMVNAFMIRFFAALMGNVFIQLLLIAVCADMVFGSLRAAKYHCWNSAVGIDGAIRKAGMLACVLLFTAIDMMMHVDVLGWIPADTRNVLDACGVVKMGVTELFALLFILYEATSVLKNMLLCGLPVPAGIQTRLAKFLDTMTDESQIDILSETGQKQEIDVGIGNKQLEALIIDKSRELARVMGIDVRENATAEELTQLIAAEVAKL